jgi:mannose-6-phosphate isomerase
MISLFEL